MTLNVGAVLLVAKDSPSCDELRKVLDSIGIERVLYSSGDDLLATDYSQIGAGCVLGRSDDESQCLDHVIQLVGAGVPTIVISEIHCDATAIGYFKAGALDVIDDLHDGFVLRDSIHRAIRLGQMERQQLAMRKHARRLAALTSRERNIVQMAADGAPNKQIARAVGLSVKSIERIRRDAYKKLEVRSTAEMTRVVILGSLTVPVA